jgi:DnaJ family protein C protein 7
VARLLRRAFVRSAGGREAGAAVLRAAELVESALRAAAGAAEVAAAVARERELASSVLAAKERANSLFTSKLYPQAVFRYGEALKLDPDNPLLCAVLLCNRAAALMQLQRFEAALADCSAALERAPRYARARARRARALVALGRDKQALADLEAALAAERDEPAAVAELERELVATRDAMRKRREAKNEERSKARSNTRSERQRSAEGAPLVVPGPDATHYDLLGVPQNASAEQVRKAYHRKALALHPDKVRGGEDAAPDDADLFKRVNAAYEVLKDAARRSDYDAELARRQLHGLRFAAYPPPFAHSAASFGSQRGWYHYYT